MIPQGFLKLAEIDKTYQALVCRYSSVATADQRPSFWEPLMCFWIHIKLSSHGTAQYNHLKKFKFNMNLLPNLICTGEKHILRRSQDFSFAILLLDLLI